MTDIVGKVVRTAKAWVAGAAVLVTALNDVLADDTLTFAEVSVVVGAAAAAWNLVYFAPPKIGKKDDE